MRVFLTFCTCIIAINFSCELTSKLGPVQIEKKINQKDCGAEASQAVVTAVNVSGTSGDYRFSVTVKSPDTGCDQYADWWEVITPDSTLIYRRILSHSHVNEQPFSRLGGPVKVDETRELIIRAHMNNLGYGCIVFSGNTLEGFHSDTISSHFALGLSETEPLPGGCAF